PQLLRMREEVRQHLEVAGVQVTELRDLRSIAPELDVVYLTREHTERLQHAQRFETEGGNYAIDAELLAALPAEARVLHPLPRGPELPVELDGDPRVACFRQAANGLYVRMALLSLLADARD
ncbi:MAG TPA: aspartate carbamoyltransferase, partial [Chloroflexota bacterium]